MSQEPHAEKIRSNDPEKFFTPPLIIIFITVFIDLIGFGMVIPILPLYAERSPFNATPLEVGMLFGIYSWMQFFFSPLLGRLSDKYGRRPVLFVSLLGSAVGYFVIGIGNTLFLVFLGRIISGITGGNISTAQAYIADVTTVENRAKGMGLFGAAFGLGFIAGPAIAGILSKYGVHVPFLFAAFLSLFNAIALYFVLPESVDVNAVRPKKTESRFAAIFGAFRQFEFGLINAIYFLLVTAFSIMTYAFVLYTSFTFAYDAEQNGYLFAYIGFAAVIGQGFLFGKLAARFGEAPLATVGCFMMAAALFFVPMVDRNTGGLTGLLVGCALLSLGNAFASPAISSLVSKISSEGEQGKALGTTQSVASLARAIGPTVGGFLLNNSVNRVDVFTIYRTFWTAAGIMFVAFLAAGFFARTMRNRLVVQNASADGAV